MKKINKTVNTSEWTISGAKNISQYGSVNGTKGRIKVNIWMKRKPFSAVV